MQFLLEGKQTTYQNDLHIESGAVLNYIVVTILNT